MAKAQKIQKFSNLILIMFCLELKDKVLKGSILLNLTRMVILTLYFGPRLNELAHHMIPISLITSLLTLHQLEVIYEELEIQLSLIHVPSLPA